MHHNEQEDKSLIQKNDTEKLSVRKLNANNIIHAYFRIRSVASFSEKHDSVDCTFESIVRLKMF